MTGIWKKQFTNHGGMRVILALLYLLATFGIGLNHTCQLVDENAHNKHRECANHKHEDDNFVETRFVFSQADCENKNQSRSVYCAACLYSLISKTFKLRSKISLCSIETTVRIQILPEFNFTKQLEWFSSIYLRAPPCITF